MFYYFLRVYEGDEDFFWCLDINKEGLRMFQLSVFIYRKGAWPENIQEMM